VYYFEPGVTAADEAEVIARFEEANRQWWELDVDRWIIGVKRYRPGECHTVHQDLHAGAAGRKLAGVVQLSDPDKYDGGALLMRFAHHAVPMPTTRGTLIAFPGWTVHEVEPVTRGERWSLCVNGWGPRLR
jgi:predicted 2-oxoglutarate/Fe(II)-dependent dioxygenase YbiX